MYTNIITSWFKQILLFMRVSPYQRLKLCKVGRPEILYSPKHTIFKNYIWYLTLQAPSICINFE